MTVFRVSDILQKKPSKKRTTFKSMMLTGTPYKLPKICRAANNDWYVEYYYLNPFTLDFKRFKVREGVNYIKDPVEKENQIRALSKAINYALTKLHYSPFEEAEILNQVIVKEETKQLAEIKTETIAADQWTLDQACTEYMAYCRWKKLADRTITGYQTFINALQEWVLDNGLQDIKARDYTQHELLLFLNTYSDQEDWTARTYNNYLDFFFTFFARVEKLEKRKSPGARYVMDLSDREYKNDTAERNRAYTPQIADLIKQQLAKAGNENLSDFVEWIYHSCMRPKEIRLLKIQHINLLARQLKAIGPTAKTGDRMVPVCDELLQLIENRKLLKLNPNWYVFGNDGNPGPLPFNKNFFAIRYRKIKDYLELDINYTMYGWKHTAVINMIYAGFSHEEIMVRTGHKDRKSFEAYIRDLIVDYSARMTGKTVAF
jgi:integrase